MGIAALIIGIISFIIGIIPACGIIALVPAILGLLLGIIDIIIKSKKQESKGIGIAGTIINALAIAFILFWCLVFVGAGSAAKEAAKEEAKKIESTTKDDSSSEESDETTAETEEPKVTETRLFKYKGINFQIPTYYGEPEKDNDGTVTFYPDGDSEDTSLSFCYSTSKTGYNYNKVKKYAKNTNRENEWKNSEIITEKNVSFNGAKSYYLVYDDGTNHLKDLWIVLKDRMIVVSFFTKNLNNDIYDYDGDYDIIIKKSKLSSKKLIPKRKKSSSRKKKKSSSGVDPDFKAAMDRYERWFNRYIKFMKKYENDPVTYLNEYAEWLEDYEKMLNKFEKIQDKDLSTADMAYYLKVHARIMKKLSKI